jgi:hypothetical protein
MAVTRLNFIWEERSMNFGKKIILTKALRSSTQSHQTIGIMVH